MERLVLSLLVLVLVLAGVASAQSAIGPFAGTEAESFETQNSPGFNPCIIDRVFNDKADLCTPGASGSSITSSWAFMCTIFPHTGSRFTGSASGHYEYTFDAPVSRFGGYFGTNSGTADGVANFFDPSDNLIGSAVITAPADCSWTWNGWQDDSGAGFARIEIFSNTSTSAFMMMDSMEIDFSSGVGTAYCFGDGTGTLCPCGNTGGTGEGCANRTGSGATLTASGSGNATNDDLTFAGAGMIPGAPALLFVGDSAIGPGGNGNAFGDGLRCAGINVVRLGVQIVDAGGNASWGPGLGATGGWVAGDTRRFQSWYRDPPPETSACGTGLNLSHGVEVTFQ